MGNVVLLSDDMRGKVEKLIKNFDDHGCGFGYDAEAQVLLRGLIDIIDRGQEVIDGISEEAR